MKIGVLGTGMVGATIVQELTGKQNSKITEIIAVDISEEYLEKSLRHLNNKDNVTKKLVDFNDHGSVVQLLSEIDIAIACLPHALSLQTIEAAIEANCHLVDLVGSKYVEKKALHEKAKQSGVLIVPGCGVAPGIVNVLAGRGVELLDEADEVMMMCGGIPKEPISPLMYRLVFRLESVIGLYTRKPTAAKNGEVIELAPFSGKEDLTFPEPVGECEAIYSDPHSVAYTLKDKVKHISEKTIRHKGHFQKMKVLHELGFLDDTSIEIDNQTVNPKQFSMEVIKPHLTKGSHEDITALRVTVNGKKSGKNTTYTWEMIDQYDKERNITSMAKTTGFPAITVAEFIIDNKIKKTGVCAPEELILGELFDDFINKLSLKGIKINKSIEEE